MPNTEVTASAKTVSFTSTEQRPLQENVLEDLSFDFKMVMEYSCCCLDCSFTKLILVVELLFCKMLDICSIPSKRRLGTLGLTFRKTRTDK